MIFRLNRAELNRSRPSRLQSASAAPCRLTCRGFAAAVLAPLSEFETKKHQVPGGPLMSRMMIIIRAFASGAQTIHPDGV
jgi:hypothetical protein